MKLQHSPNLTALLGKLTEEQFDRVHEIANSTCTTGYDNDGSTGIEIFENGFDLRGAVGPGDHVFYGERDGQALFFIAQTEQEAIDSIELADEDDLPDPAIG